LQPVRRVSEEQILELKAPFLDASVVLVPNVALPLMGDQVDEFLKFAAANAVIADIIGNLKGIIPDLGEAGKWRVLRSNDVRDHLERHLQHHPGRPGAADAGFPVANTAASTR
jgi:hypothetical protein